MAKDGLGRGYRTSRMGRTSLVRAWFTAVKAAEDATEPPYSEFTPADNTLLDGEDIDAITQEVWPEDPDEDTELQSN